MDEPPSFQIAFILSDQGLLYVLFTALFLVLSAWASSVEAAFFALHPDDIERFRTSGDNRETSVAKLLEQPRLLLNALATWKYLFLIATSVFTVTLHTYSLHIESLNDVSIATMVVALTVLFALCGVILAKIYGSTYAVPIARNNSTAIRRMVKAFKVLVAPLLLTSERVEKKLDEKTEEKSQEALSNALQLATIDNEPIEGEEEILTGIVNFGTLRVNQVMKQRHEVVFADVSWNFDALLDFVKRSGYSRVPACRGTLDHVDGFLYIKDLLPFLREGTLFPWQRLLRPAYRVQDSRKIDYLLKEFQEKRVHMALVMQQNHTVGLITLEDIIEELIGDINDEFDEVGARYHKVDENTFLFDGKTSIQEFCKVVNINPSFFPVKGLNESIGGILLEVHEGLPAVGEEIQIAPFIFTVESVDRKRVKRVRVQRMQPKTEKE